MNLKEAQTIIEKVVMAGKPDCAIIPEATREHKACFTFSYQSKAYLESKDIRDMLVGHGPVLIDKNNGEVFETGSAYSEEHYVQAFEACGDPLAHPTNKIVLNGWVSGAKKVAAATFIKNVSDLSLAKAKEAVDKALNHNSTTFTVTSLHKASEVVNEIRDLGFRCKQLWNKS